MSEEKILDIAHVSFLDMLNVVIKQTGSGATKGTLIRNTMGSAEKFQAVDFQTFDDFIESIESIDNPIARIEGKSVHKGNGLFGLPNCPFSKTIANYKEVAGKLPEVYAEFTEEFNKKAPISDKLKVGSGAGVSPFCAIHQPLRSSLGQRITIGGKPIVIHQLGCKSGGGVKGFAEAFITETGHSKQMVEQILEDNMCCYSVTVSQ